MKTPQGTPISSKYIFIVFEISIWSIILLLFAASCRLYYHDAIIGYKKSNEIACIQYTFQDAFRQFALMDSRGTLTPKEWKTYASNQSVKFPENRSVLPDSITDPMPWPEILRDFDRMKSQGWILAWRDYSMSKGLPERLVERVYDGKVIDDQLRISRILMAPICIAFLPLLILSFQGLTKACVGQTKERSEELHEIDGSVKSLKDIKIKNRKKYLYLFLFGLGLLILTGKTSESRLESLETGKDYFFLILGILGSLCLTVGYFMYLLNLMFRNKINRKGGTGVYE